MAVEYTQTVMKLSKRQQRGLREVDRAFLAYKKKRNSKQHKEALERFLVLHARVFLTPRGL